MLANWHFWCCIFLSYLQESVLPPSLSCCCPVMVSYLRKFRFPSKDLRKQFVFSDLHCKTLSTHLELWKEQGKFSVGANLPEFVPPPFLFSFLRTSTPERTPHPGLWCHFRIVWVLLDPLSKLMLRDPLSLVEESSWLLAWGPCIVGVERDTPWRLWMTQEKWERASSALCAWRTCSLSISCTHIMRKSTPGKTVMSKGKLKVRG